MKALARFITRPKEGHQPDLGLMAFFRSNNLLKANRVYEIQEILGELVIRDVGECRLGMSISESHPTAQVCWGNDVGYILDVGDKYIFLTREETDGVG